MSDKYTLLAPGPVQVPPEVLTELAKPVIHHRTPEFTQILGRVLEGLKWAFQTQNPVLILPTTGSGAMEAALVNTLSRGDRVCIVNSGKFGERWVKMAQIYGLVVDEIKVKWGKTVDPQDILTHLKEDTKAVFCQAVETSTAVYHPIETIAQQLKEKDTLFIVDAISALGACPMNPEEWGIDVLLAGSQKAFMTPPGLAFISLSDKAWQACENSDLPKFYLNLMNEKKANEKGQTFFSSSVTLIRALDKALRYFKGDKLKGIADRAQGLQQKTLESLEKLGLEVFSSCPTLTAMKVPDGVDGNKLRSHIEKHYNVTFMGGQDHLKGKIIRIGHIGYIVPGDLFRGLQALCQSLIELDFHLDKNKIDEALAPLKDY